MDHKKIENIIQADILISELSNKLGTHFRESVTSQLYEWWRNNRLTVRRTWRGILEPAEVIPYSNSACFLPDDRIQLKKRKSLDSLKIATWNVNSIRIRLPLILSWLEEQQADIVCLQETKTEDHQFPEQELREAGYSCVYHGQKSYNGVAILSKYPFESVQYGFKSRYDTENKRLLISCIEGINIINVYVPQGQTESSPKFQYKLEFLDNLIAELDGHFSSDDRVILLGDINIAPDNRDVVSPEAMQNMVSFHPKEHAIIDRFRRWGLTDIYRQFHHEGGLYSWWDFRTCGFEKNEGMRIDHIWVTDPVAQHCDSCEIDTNNRSQTKPSDHAPVICVVKTNNH